MTPLVVMVMLGAIYAAIRSVHRNAEIQRAHDRIHALIAAAPEVEHVKVFWPGTLPAGVYYDWQHDHEGDLRIEPPVEHTSEHAAA